MPSGSEINTFVEDCKDKRIENAKQALNQHGAALVNAKDEVGNAALMGAAYNGRVQVTRMLLDAGADANISGKNGNTALRVAAHLGHVQVAQMLLDAEADSSKRDKCGDTPLHWAIIFGSPVVSQLLAEEFKRSGMCCCVNIICPPGPCCCILCPILCPVVSLPLHLLSLYSDGLFAYRDLVLLKCCCLGRMYMAHTVCSPCINWTRNRAAKIAAEEDEARRAEIERQERQQKAEAESRATERKVKAAGFGISENELDEYTQLLVNLDKYRRQRHREELQKKIDRAVESFDTGAIRLLAEQRKAIEPPQISQSVTSLITTISHVIETNRAYFRELATEDNFDASLADLCAMGSRRLETLLSTLNIFTTSNDITAVEEFLASSQVEFTTVSVRDNTADAADKGHGDMTSRSVQFGVVEESSSQLGLSTQLCSKYTLVLDDLEALRDLDAIRDVDRALEAAKTAMNTALILELGARRKKLKVSAKNIVLADVKEQLNQLVEEVKAYFKGLADADIINKEYMDRCVDTFKYLEELLSSINNKQKLTVALDARFQFHFDDGIVFPDGVRRINWKDVRIFGSNTRDVVVGRGSFSTVVKAKLMMNGSEWDVAIKVLNQSYDTDYPQLCSDVLKEAEIIATLTAKMMNKALIVNIYGVAIGVLPTELTSFFQLRDGAKGVGLVMRYEAGGSLANLIHAARNQSLLHSLSLERKLSLILNIVDGVRDLHMANGVHGDLKPENIMLSDMVNLLPRLGDFGVSEVRKGQEDAANGTTLIHTSVTKGTRIYCAPEMLTNPNVISTSNALPSTTVAKASRKTDMYALALLIYEIMSGKKPFADVGTDETALSTRVHNNGRPSLADLPSDTPPTLRDMIVACWDSSRDKRLTATECYHVVYQILNVISSGSYDIFFSHAWVDMCVLAHVSAMLTALGYRVWYDVNDMGWDLDRSMRDGISRSKVLLACVNSTYQSRRNCMFELEEGVRLHPDKPIVGLVLENVISNGQMLSNIDDRVKRALKYPNNMLCLINEVVADPRWKECEARKEDPPTELLVRLKNAIQLLPKVLIQAGCHPSLPPSSSLSA